jgi:hypothetical protein
MKLPLLPASLPLLVCIPSLSQQYCQENLPSTRGSALNRQAAKPASVRNPGIRRWRRWKQPICLFARILRRFRRLSFRTITRSSDCASYPKQNLRGRPCAGQSSSGARQAYEVSERISKHVCPDRLLLNVGFQSSSQPRKAIYQGCQLQPCNGPEEQKALSSGSVKAGLLCANEETHTKR